MGRGDATPTHPRGIAINCSPSVAHGHDERQPETNSQAARKTSQSREVGHFVSPPSSSNAGSWQAALPFPAWTGRAAFQLAEFGPKITAS